MNVGSIADVKSYYGNSYKKILNALVGLDGKFTFDIDNSYAGRYLELSCADVKGAGIYFKVNHGISNEYPYNTWYKRGRWEEAITNRFHTQAEVAKYIEEIFKRYK